MKSIQETIAVISEDIIVDADIDGAFDDVSNAAEDQYVGNKVNFKTSQTVKSILPACVTVTIVLTNDRWTHN
jgi:hypothetical protein